MITIHPVGLATLLAEAKTVDVVDVRPKEKFERSHIDGAQSAPLHDLRAAKLLHERKSTGANPLFIVSGDRVSAGMAACMLRGAGCAEPVVVDGGMKAWEAEGLPAVRSRRVHRWPHHEIFTRQLHRFLS